MLSSPDTERWSCWNANYPNLESLVCLRESNLEDSSNVLRLLRSIYAIGRGVAKHPTSSWCFFFLHISTFFYPRWTWQELLQTKYNYNRVGTVHSAHSHFSFLLDSLLDGPGRNDSSLGGGTVGVIKVAVSLYIYLIPVDPPPRFFFGMKPRGTFACPTICEPL